MKLLDSDILQKDKTEIIKFLLLPRNTPVQPMIELPDEEQQAQYGPVKRPDSTTLQRRSDPNKAGNDEQMSKVLESVT